MSVKLKKSSRPAGSVKTVDRLKTLKALGRSRLTGSYVMKPMAKRAHVSLKDVRSAVRALNAAAGK